MRRGELNARGIAPAAIALVWMLSLALPAIEVSGGPTLSGFELLLRGWEGASRGVFAWFANPLFIGALALTLARRDGAAGVVSTLALALGLTSFATEAVIGRVQPVPELTLLAGFYVWLAALAALCAFCLRAWLAVRRFRHVSDRADGE